MKNGGSEIQTFSFGQDLVFDAYIMFQEYIGFVKAMNSLKGMKLLYKDRYEDRAWVANIKVLNRIVKIISRLIFKIHFDFDDGFNFILHLFCR